MERKAGPRCRPSLFPPPPKGMQEKQAQDVGRPFPKKRKWNEAHCFPASPPLSHKVGNPNPKVAPYLVTREAW